MTKFRAVPGRSLLLLEGQSSLHPVRTSTTDMEGYLEAELLDGNHVDFRVSPMGRLEVDVESLKAGNELYDLEMQRRLDPRRYPTIVAELIELRPLNVQGQYHAVGNLSFHGVTRRLEGVMTIIRLDDRSLELSGEHTFDVRTFRVTPPQVFTFKVNPVIQVTLRAIVERVDS